MAYKKFKSILIKKIQLCECGCGKFAKPGNKYIYGHQNIGKTWTLTKKLCECGCKKEINRNEIYFPGHEPKKCACGCGELASPRKTYIRGHANRKYHKSSKPLYPKLCQCGCGDFAKIGNRFILGHQSAVTKWKASEKMKGKLLHSKSSYWKGQYYQSPYQERIWLRSSYEIKYAEYLDRNNIDWLYECETFDLYDTTYTPDFYLIKEKRFIEIKGWMSEKAQDKIDVFRKYYPEERLEVLFREDLIKLKIKI